MLHQDRHPTALTQAPARRGRRGFTLMEFMFAVALLAILSALAVPMFRDTDRSKVAQAAGMVVADLEYAQAESIAHGDAPRAFVVNSTTTYSIATTATPNTPITNPIGKGSYSTTFGSDRASALSGVTISSYSLNGDNILGFGIYGQPDQTGDGTLTISCGTRSVVITINGTTGAASIGTVN